MTFPLLVSLESLLQVDGGPLVAAARAASFRRSSTLSTALLRDVAVNVQSAAASSGGAPFAGTMPGSAASALPSSGLPTPPPGPCPPTALRASRSQRSFSKASFPPHGTLMDSPDGVNASQQQQQQHQAAVQNSAMSFTSSKSLMRRSSLVSRASEGQCQVSDEAILSGLEGL